MVAVRALSSLLLFRLKTDDDETRIERVQKIIVIPYNSVLANPAVHKAVLACIYTYSGELL